MRTEEDTSEREDVEAGTEVRTDEKMDTAGGELVIGTRRWQTQFDCEISVSESCIM